MPLTQIARSRAFSLVEVVLALGVASFSIVALMGLFTIGYQSSKESEENIAAANLASVLITQRRAAPYGIIDVDNDSKDDLGIPPLSPAPAPGLAWIYLKSDGTKASGAAEAECRLTYQISAGTDLATIYLLLTWPPEAEPAKAAGRYELLSQIALP